MVTATRVDPRTGVRAEKAEQVATASAEVSRRVVLAAAIPVALGTLLLDARTLLPGVSVWDTAEFQAIGPVLGIAHPTGYPSYTLLAWLASVVLQPFGDEALRANLLSAILAAIGTGAVAAVVTVLTRRASAGIVAGVGLALAPVAWRIGLRADPHALHFALVGLLLALLVAWMLAERRDDPRAGRRLLAAAFVFGVSLGNHALTLLLAPGIALLVLLVSPRLPVRRPRLVLGSAAVLVLTTVTLYAYIPIRSMMDPPLDYADAETWERFRYLVLGEQFRGTFRAYPPLSEALGTIRDEVVGALGVLAAFGVLGAVASALRRPALFLLTASWFLIPFVFALGYENADIRRYYLVPVLVVAVWAGLGLEAAWLLARRASAAAWPPIGAWLDGAPRDRRDRALTGVVGPLVAAVLVLAPTLWILPQRYREVDASRETWAREWLDAALAVIPRDAVVISWWGFSTPLWYGQFVEGARSDVLVLDDRTLLDRDLGTARDAILRYRAERPVVLIRLGDEIRDLDREFGLTRLEGVPSWGTIWQVGSEVAEPLRERAGV